MGSKVGFASSGRNLWKIQKQISTNFIIFEFEIVIGINKIVTQSSNHGTIWRRAPEFHFEINEGIVSRFWLLRHDLRRP